METESDNFKQGLDIRWGRGFDFIELGFIIIPIFVVIIVIFVLLSMFDKYYTTAGVASQEKTHFCLIFLHFSLKNVDIC